MTCNSFSCGCSCTWCFLTINFTLQSVLFKISINCFSQSCNATRTLVGRGIKATVEHTKFQNML
ncbi:hypothetical protein HanPSC8_Chr11g0469851 [Helianthus annuus]|nr:hypothetical protein HanPSC8_Chr11g0469851 [Helianthus annuus]